MGYWSFPHTKQPALQKKGVMCILGHIWGKRVVLSFRSELKSQRVDRWFMGFKRWIVRCCDVLICQSDAAAQAAIDLLGARQEQIMVIPNWINSEFYQRAVQSSNTTRPIAFVYVGRLETYKGLYELLDAAHNLQQEGEDFQLILCGGGSQQRALEERCRTLGLETQVQFRGWIDKSALIDVFAKSDVFILPSYSEGLPNALLEAMASGLAVITTPVGGIPSVVDEPQNGLLVPAHDVTALAHAMLKLASDPAMVEEMGERNVERIARNHDINRVWPRVAQALNVKTTSF